MVARGSVYPIRQLPSCQEVAKVEDLLTAARIEQMIKASGEHQWREGRSLDSVRLLSPILSPSKVLMAAVNYGAHRAEGRSEGPKEPFFFSKLPSCIIGNGDPIIIPRVSQKADWEAELAVVIGKKGKYIEPEQAIDHVAGFTVANDVSFRDLQFLEGWPEGKSGLGQNFVKGKSLDNALPLGPWLVTKDELPDTSRLKISLTVNGQLRQDSTTADMIFQIPRLIQDASAGITLLPGDIISTGTPAGVAAFSGAPFLKDGDIVEASVEGIGSLRNPVVQER